MESVAVNRHNFARKKPKSHLLSAIGLPIVLQTVNDGVELVIQFDTRHKLGHK